MIRTAVVFLCTLTLLLALAGASMAGGSPASKRPGVNGETPMAGPMQAKPGEVLVRFKPQVGRAEALAAIQEQAWTTGGLARMLGGSVAFAVQREYATLAALSGQQTYLLQTTLDVAQAVAQFQADPRVASVSPNFLRRASAVPNDSSYAQQWGLGRIAAPGGWDVTTDASSVVIASLDSGVDYTHEDLAANLWTNSTGGTIAYGRDTLYEDDEPMDDNGHGTHTAGIMAAVGNNAKGIAGVAWSAKIMALKFLDSRGEGLDSDAIQALQYLLDRKLNHGDNVRVVNASWGSHDYNPVLEDVIRQCGEQGIILVAAAGNDNLDNDVVGQYPGSFDLPNVVAVAATQNATGVESLDTRYSNTGQVRVGLAAPGSSILSTLPGGGYTAVNASAVYRQEFTSGLAGWTPSEGSTWGVVNGGLEDSPGGFYADLTNASVTSPTIALAAATGDVRLGFRATYSLEEESDFVFIEYSKDNGATWEGAGRITGVATNATAYALPISPKYRTNSFQVRFRLVSDVSITADGIRIDDVAVGVGPGYSNTYDSYTGTSMATPHVAGAAALLAARYPGDDVATRINRLYSGADSLPSLVGKTSTGGRLNLQRTLASGLTLLPYIQSVNPKVGLRTGATLTITGQAFGLQTGASKVLFGAAQAAIVSWSDTTIVCQVPSGAGRLVSVVNGNGTSNPKQIFAWQAMTSMTGDGKGRISFGSVASGGKIYVFGGYTSFFSDAIITGSTSAEVYDPATDTWSALPDVPGDPRANFAIAEYNGIIYLMGGTVPGSKPTQYLDSCLAFNTSTQQWSSIPSYPQRAAWAKAAVVNGKVYVAGGINNNGEAINAMYYYTPSASWSTPITLPQDPTEPMHTGRFEHGMAAVNGKLYLFGGTVLNVATTGCFSSVMVYDPATSTWANSWDAQPKAAAMPHGLARMAVTTDGKKIYVTGGTSQRGDVPWWYWANRDLLTFDPSSNAWQYDASQPTQMSQPRLAGGLVYLRGKGLYSLGGASQGNPLRSVERLDVHGMSMAPIYRLLFQ